MHLTRHFSKNLIFTNYISTKTYFEEKNLEEDRARVLNTANKADLELEEARPLVFDKTAYAMSAFF